MFILTYQYDDDLAVAPIIVGVSSTIDEAKTYAEETMGFRNTVWSEINFDGEVSGTISTGSTLVIEPVKVLDSKILEKD